MLLREFQIAAREQFGAQDSQPAGPPDASRLRQVDLQQVDPAAKLPDAFIPHGNPDAATLAAIDVWLLGTSRLRSPIIFQAYLPGTARAPWQTIDSQGFCFHDELTNTKARVFARDFTGRYQPLPDGSLPRIPVGTAIARRIKDNGTNIKVYGSASKPAHSLRSFDPDHVAGKAWQAMTAGEQSTFRVTAALAHVEAGGILDGINAYDSSVLSAGPYHYTAFPAGAVGPSELAAFLAYYASRAASEYDTMIKRMGISAREAWDIALFNQYDRTYRASLGFAAANGGMPAPTTVIARDWLRTWPSFYRIQVALREASGLHACIWPFARQRIHDVLGTSWGSGAPPGATTLGDVFKSELTIAQLLRWHVFRPRHIVDGGPSGPVPGLLVKAAGLAAKPIGTWTDADDAKLSTAFASASTTKGLAGYCAASLVTSLKTLRNWTVSEWNDGAAGTTLRKQRNFVLFATGIPFP